ncbi:7462_t:CDS:2 [Cetraspora pellucida]|uniref:7462_t:CDS:1 n=1 Tax=Cetraspora pellucida TaxID=1433469 RepID=A0A9N9GC93_9GLOM|nr:7462_t:CDS:2 [Cetraspora pellucida]
MSGSGKTEDTSISRSASKRKDTLEDQNTQNDSDNQESSNSDKQKQETDHKKLARNAEDSLELIRKQLKQASKRSIFLTSSFIGDELQLYGKKNKDEECSSDDATTSTISSPPLPSSKTRKASDTKPLYVTKED